MKINWKKIMADYLEKPQTSWDIQKNIYVHSLIDSLKNYHRYNNSMNRAIIIFRVVKVLLDKSNIENNLHYIQLENRNVGMVLDCGGVFWSMFGSDSKKQIALQFGVEECNLKISKAPVILEDSNLILDNANYDSFLLNEYFIDNIYFVKRKKASLDFSQMILGDKDFFEFELEKRKNILTDINDELGVYSWHELEEITSFHEEIIELKNKLLDYSRTNESELVITLIEKIQKNEEKLMDLFKDGKDYIVSYDLSDEQRKYKKIKLNQNNEKDEKTLLLLLEIYDESMTIERNPVYDDTTHNNKYIPISLNFMKSTMYGSSFNLIKDNKIMCKKVIDLNSNELIESYNFDEITKMKNEKLLKNSLSKTKQPIKNRRF